MKKILYFMVAGIGLLASCTKGDLVENTEYEKLEYADPKYSYIKIQNVTPSSPVVNFYLDGLKFSAQQSTLGIENAGYAYNGIFPDLGYAVTSPGTHTLTAKIIPTATADANLEVFNQTINPAAGKYYTIFTTGIYSTTVAPVKKIPSITIIEDTKPALDTSKIFVRVANFLNGGPTVDLTKDLATGPKIISGVAYGTASGWAEIPALTPGSTNAVKLFMNNSTTNTPLIAAGTTVTLTKGRAYTIYSRGIVGNASFAPTITFYTTFY